MTTRAGLVVCALLLAALGFVGGINVGGDGEAAEDVASHVGAESANADADEQLRLLRAQLARFRERDLELTSELEKLRGEHPDSATAAVVDGGEGDETGTTAAAQPGEPRARADVGDRAAQELLQRGDIEGLWLLAANLLAQGEPGYQKLVELGTWLMQNQESFGALGRLWRSEELFIGPLLQAAGDNVAEILRFGLYLDGLEPDQIPELLRDFQKELSDEMGAVLLGYYSGDDAELLDGYVEKYRREFESAGSSDRYADERIMALAQINSEASTQLLLELLEDAPGELMDDLVRGLAWQRSAEALPALEDLRLNPGDPELIPLIDAAIQYLQ